MGHPPKCRRHCLYNRFNISISTTELVRMCLGEVITIYYGDLFYLRFLSAGEISKIGHLTEMGQPERGHTPLT